MSILMFISIVKYSWLMIYLFIIFTQNGCCEKPDCDGVEVHYDNEGKTEGRSEAEGQYSSIGACFCCDGVEAFMSADASKRFYIFYDAFLRLWKISPDLCGRTGTDLDQWAISDIHPFGEWPGDYTVKCMKDPDKEAHLLSLTEGMWILGGLVVGLIISSILICAVCGVFKKCSNKQSRPASHTRIRLAHFFTPPNQPSNPEGQDQVQVLPGKSNVTFAPDVDVLQTSHGLDRRRSMGHPTTLPPLGDSVAIDMPNTVPEVNITEDKSVVPVAPSTGKQKPKTWNLKGGKSTPYQQSIKKKVKPSPSKVKKPPSYYRKMVNDHSKN